MTKKYIDAGDINLDEEVFLLKDGTRLTEAEADLIGREMSDEAAKARRAGRPSLTGGTSHSPHVSTRVPEATRARLETRAASEGKRISDIVREAIERYV